MEGRVKLPFEINESLFVTDAMCRKAKHHLMNMPIGKAMRIAGKHRWMANDGSEIELFAVCPGCGWNVVYRKDGNSYHGHCHNCRNEIRREHESPDMFIEEVYDDFYHNAFIHNVETRCGKTLPCDCCKGTNVEVCEIASGKWIARCADCQRSLEFPTPTAESAIAVWNQHCLDSVKIEPCKECHTNNGVVTVDDKYGFFCRCERCGTRSIYGSTRSSAWRKWNVMNRIADEDDSVKTDRIAILEEENRFLKKMLVKFIGASALLKDAGDSMAKSLAPIHAASSSIVESLKSLPTDDWKAAPRSLVDFINMAFNNTNSKETK